MNFRNGLYCTVTFTTADTAVLPEVPVTVIAEEPFGGPVVPPAVPEPGLSLPHAIIATAKAMAAR